MGEIREEVYIAQARLCEELEELFAALDKAEGQATGQFPKVPKLLALYEMIRKLNLELVLHNSVFKV